MFGPPCTCGHYMLSHGGLLNQDACCIKSCSCGKFISTRKKAEDCAAGINAARFLSGQTQISISIAFSNHTMGMNLFSAIDSASAPTIQGHMTLTAPTIMDDGAYLVQVTCPQSRLRELARLVESFCTERNIPLINDKELEELIETTQG